MLVLDVQDATLVQSTVQADGPAVVAECDNGTGDRYDAELNRIPILGGCRVERLTVIKRQTWRGARCPSALQFAADRACDNRGLEIRILVSEDGNSSLGVA